MTVEFLSAIALLPATVCLAPTVAVVSGAPLRLLFSLPWSGRQAPGLRGVRQER